MQCANEMIGSLIKRWREVLLFLGTCKWEILPGAVADLIWVPFSQGTATQATQFWD